MVFWPFGSVWFIAFGAVDDIFDESAVDLYDAAVAVDDDDDDEVDSSIMDCSVWCVLKELDERLLSSFNEGGKYLRRLCWSSSSRLITPMTESNL